MRAVGTTDALTLGEKRSRVAAAEAYETPEVVDDDGTFASVAERWRPFRTWVAGLLRATGLSAAAAAPPRLATARAARPPLT